MIEEFKRVQKGNECDEIPFLPIHHDPSGCAEVKRLKPSAESQAGENEGEGNAGNCQNGSGLIWSSASDTKKNMSQAC